MCSVYVIALGGAQGGVDGAVGVLCCRLDLVAILWQNNTCFDLIM